jgi:hypothetical protein
VKFPASVVSVRDKELRLAAIRKQDHNVHSDHRSIDQSSGLPRRLRGSLTVRMAAATSLQPYALIR